MSTVTADPGAARVLKPLHPFVILSAVLLIAVVSTWFTPAGEYDRTEVDGREVVVDGTYQAMESQPAGLGGLLSAIHLGMVDASQIIFFIFIVGGAFGVLARTRAVEDGIAGLADRMKGTEILLIPVVMLIFGLAGATFGMFEEALPFVLVLTPIAVRLGFDSMVGAAMVLVGVSSGFTAAITNPFTIGVAQGIADVPLFSGIGPRVVFWLVFMAVSIGYVMWYARRVQKDPDRSFTAAADQEHLAEMEDQASEVLAADVDGRTGTTTRQKLVLGTLVLTLVALVYGVTQFGWYMTEISALFVAMAVVMGAVGGLGIAGTAEAFTDGCQEMVVGALCVGFAYATLVVLQDAGTIDSILHGITSAVSGLSSWAAAVGMLGVQSLLNFIVTSGSGQAALSMPLMAPLSDLLGVDRQTAVLAFQMGDGISNIFAPTSGLLLAALALAKLSYGTWFRFIWPLIVIHYLLAAVFVTVAHLFIWPA